MTIKMIAVDMDGTFLNEQKEYDRPRFRRLLTKMKERQIAFVVASGNQYALLRRYFSDCADELSFVADNGAFVKDRQTVLCEHFIPKHIAAKALGVIDSISDIQGVVTCTDDATYVNLQASDDFMKHTQLYSVKLTPVAHLEDYLDHVFKLCVHVPQEKTSSVLPVLKKALGPELTPVPSGYGDMDIIQTGLHKANGLQMLQDRYHIGQHELAAFGDSHNDLEMLQHAAFSYAMANGAPEVKKAARFVIGDNNSTALLDAVEALIDQNTK